MDDVEADDAYWGGEKPEKCGRDAKNKTAFVAAVQTNSDDKSRRFNRHFDLTAMTPFLLRAAVTTKTYPLNILRLSKASN